MVGGAPATIARLRDPDLRERLRDEIEDEGSDGFHGIPMDWSIVVDGRQLDRRARRELGPAAGRLLLRAAASTAASALSAIAHVGNEENVRAMMPHSCHTVGSDGILVGDRPHPRGWGTFPRYFAVYVRELGLLAWSMRSAG